MRIVLAMLLLAAGCSFDPRGLDGDGRPADAADPDSTVTDPDGGSPDAADLDAAVIDAGPMIDAADIDAMIPIDAPPPIDAMPIDAGSDPFCTSTGLQACFRMNQGSGAPIDGHSPAISITRADAVNYVPGCRGTALDHSAGVYVRTGAPAAAITNLTAEAWVKLNNVPSVAAARRYWFDAENSWGLSYTTDIGGTVNVRCLIVIGPGNFPSVSAALPNPTGWNHVACTWDSSRLRLFINGTMTEVNPSNDPIIDGNVGFQLGRNAVDQDGATEGQMDDVRVWNRRVPDAEIQATAMAGCQ